ncbi:C2 family cysteine protease [Streptomyces gamaensis]|uniref:C2 family cysteine protease n=1 Tax=Streptomyces gamaensis TaxID=1763542 RepID=A0ABW0Z8M3_9ACTN
MLSALKRTEPSAAAPQRRPSVRESRAERERTAGGVQLTTWDLSQLTLWSRTGYPRPDDVRQGEVGDCVYLATLAALAYVDPASLENRIKPLPNGRYKVRLDRTVEVGPLVHARPACPTGLYADGRTSSWVALMEKALAKRKSPLLGAPSYEALDGCKKVSTALKLLGYGIECEGDAGDEPLEGALDEAMSGLDQRRVVIAGLDMGEEEDQHAFAVLGYDADTIRLYDPHGRHETLSHDEFSERVRCLCVSGELSSRK